MSKKFLVPIDAVGTTVTADGLTAMWGTTLNEGGNDADTRIEGDNDQNLVFVDASTDRVGIGTNVPGAKLHVNGALLLAADPGNPLEAATKQYVDAIADEIWIGPTPPANTTMIWFDTSQVGMEENARYFKNVTTSTYTFLLEDRGKLLEFDNAAATTVTIPTDATAAFVVGTQIDVVQMGAGQVTIVGAGGVTVRYTPTNKLRVTNSSGSLVKRATNDWWLFGDMALA